MNVLENRNASLRKLIEAIENDRLGAMRNSNCVYRDNQGRNCAIGCMLSNAELDTLVRDDHLESAYGVLTFAYSDIEVRLGITRYQGESLQEWHDLNYVPGHLTDDEIKEMINLLNQVIAGEIEKFQPPGTGEGCFLDFSELPA